MSAPDTGLSETVLKALRAVFERWPAVEQVVLYGSRAKGNYRSGSDIDLCLQAPALSYAEQLQLENELDDLLLPYTLDLCCAHRLQSPELKAHIERVGWPLYRRALSQTDLSPAGG